MSGTLQSANLSSGKHTDIFPARLANKTAGRCSKEYCPGQRRLEMKFSHCSTQTWRRGAKAATGGLVFHHIQQAKSSTIKNGHYRVLSQVAENSDSVNCLTSSSFFAVPG